MRGGTEATVTDADVVLGYLNPAALLGGNFQIDAALAEKAIRDNIAGPLGMEVSQAALGIFEIVNRNMANAMGEISLERGYDPRDFVMIAAGGQGPVHAAELARELNIGTVIIPRLASTFCAFGMLASDLRHDYKRSFAFRLPEVDFNSLGDLFREMEEIGRADLALEGVDSDEVFVTRRLEMRYIGQIYEVPVDVTEVSLKDGDVRGQIEEKLHQQHEKEFTYRHETGVGEIINANVTALGRLPEVKLPELEMSGRDGSAAQLNERPMLFREYDKYRDVPVYDGTLLLPGNLIMGPAVVEEPNTTVVVFPGFELELTPLNAYILRTVS